MRGAFGSLLALVVVAAVGAVSAQESVRQPTTGPAARLFDAYYDFEVLLHCGLADEPARRGFRARLRYLLTRDNWSESDHREIRHQAWAAGFDEWQNRGLGGYKPWCEADGALARDRLIDYLRDPAGPDA